MARKQDFASKISKMGKKGPTCPTCGNVYTYIKKVTSYLSEQSHTWRFSTHTVRVCHCNEKEVYA